MQFVRCPDWNGKPAYQLEGAFFYAIGRLLRWELRVAVLAGSPLHRLFERWT